MNAEDKLSSQKSPEEVNESSSMNHTSSVSSPIFNRGKQFGSLKSEKEEFPHVPTFNEIMNSSSKSSDLREMPGLIKQLNEATCYSLINSKFDSALECLKKAEEMLELIVSSSIEIDRNYIIATMYNFAVYYQKNNMHEECINYLDASLFHMNSKNTSLNSIPFCSNINEINGPGIGINIDKLNIINKISKFTWLIRMNLQMCAMLSQISKHSVALTHAKSAIECSNEVIREYRNLLKLATNQINSKNFQNKKKKK